MKVNRIAETKYVDGITGEILSPLTIVVDSYVVEDFDAENNFIVLVLEKDHYKYIAWNYRKKISLDDFLSKCSACGGNWVAMLFSGMKRVYPEVYEVIPENETFNFFELTELLEYCGVEF